MEGARRIRPCKSITLDASVHFDAECPSESRKYHSLREWIQKPWRRTKLQAAVSEPSKITSEQVKLIIPLAAKLAKCLSEAEMTEQKGKRNPIPLTSITAEKVIIKIEDTDPLTEVFDQPEEFLFMDNSDIEDTAWDEKAEKEFDILLDEIDEPQIVGNKILDGIDQSTILFRAEENQNTGSKTSRLFAFGSILYELFSGQRLLSEQGSMYKCAPENSVSFKDVNLNHEASSCDLHENSRTKRGSSFTANSESHGSIQTKLIAELGFLGIPQSLGTLISHLLDCSQGEFCGDDAYRSFSDVHSDLQLMIDDPSRFLDDIDVNSQPSFSIDDKLYGRVKEVARIDEAYQKFLQGECKGVFIVGGSGVGKSKLAMHVKDLTSESKGYFVTGKFDQNQDLKPLSVIASAFNECIDMFFGDSPDHQRKAFSNALRVALGFHLSALIQLLPGLSKSLEITSKGMESYDRADSAKPIGSIFCTLAETIYAHLSRPITLFLDDLQWADESSLLLIRELLGDSNTSRYLFIVCCFRDTDGNENDDSLSLWCNSTLGHPIARIDLGNLDVEEVNKFVSDALRISPRLTFPLSSVLYHKTRGNPLFLRRILDSLKQQNHLYFSLKSRGWMWDIDKITDLKIADDVVSLLMKEMQTLPEELQLGLKVASCLGGSFDKALINIISKDLEVDLQDILFKISQKGFIDEIETKYRFVHDRIQQAAYEIMSPEQRGSNHLRFGLAIYAYSLEKNQSDEIFFTSVNQINHGGHQASLDLDAKNMIASLNLKAGKRSIILSDFHSAFKFFERGISSLSANHWVEQYELSLELFDAIAEAACVMNNVAAVKLYSDAVLTHGRCFDDKLRTLYVALKAFRHSNMLQEAKKSAFDILSQIGEECPPLISNRRLQSDLQKIDDSIAGMSDEFIFNLKHTEKKKMITLMKLYHTLFHVLILIEPSRLGGVSLRMVELTLSEGLCSLAPLAFAGFGITLMSTRKPANAYRMGMIALRLIEKLKSARAGFCNSSDVICAVNQFISWTSEPLQAISESHLLGHKTGKQSGDALSSILNYQFFLLTSFFSGHSVNVVKKATLGLIEELIRKSQKVTCHHVILLYLHTVTLTRGPAEEENSCFVQLPTVANMYSIASSTNQSDLLIAVRIYQLMKTFFFRNYDEIPLDTNICREISEQKYPLRILLLAGIFFEGLISYHMARQTNNEKWLAKGDAALSEMKWWSRFSPWNFENKSLLLEAESMYFHGDFERASLLYEKSILAARKHKFVHEEAIACELAGMYYYERKLYQESYTFLGRSLECYQNWGATAVVDKIKQFMEKSFDSMTLPSLS